MIRAVLIDLDDTLLGNKMEQFLPVYFQKLGEYLSDRIDPAQMLTELLAGTQQMLLNLDPTCTLERAFSQHFYPAIGFEEEPMRLHIERFYREVFPSLKAGTAGRPAARAFIDRLQERGLDIVVATNPLFPRIAIEERLRWAGTPAAEIPFSIVTSYEQFHFTKPHPEYYAEILGRLGLPPQDTVMIGNDPAADLAPARLLGMATFHLSEEPEQGYRGGNFTQVLSWLDEDPGVKQRENAKSPEAILARARGHLAALISMLEGLNGARWSTTLGTGEWSLAEIMCHLRDVEREVHLERLGRMLEEPEAHLVGEDTDAWAAQRQYDCQPGQDAFSDFVQSRLELIDRLASLQPQEWQRTGRHTMLGPIHLNELMAIANDHDTIHLAQVRKTLASIPA
ncbi:MAG: HAD family hydrolase [Anaerolineales bacterium]|nr:MAG: HAD family hydrolase [Anaerolineales bacterium]